MTYDLVGVRTTARRWERFGGGWLIGQLDYVENMDAGTPCMGLYFGYRKPEDGERISLDDADYVYLGYVDAFGWDVEYTPAGARYAFEEAMDNYPDLTISEQWTLKEAYVLNLPYIRSLKEFEWAHANTLGIRPSQGYELVAREVERDFLDSRMLELSCTQRGLDYTSVQRIIEAARRLDRSGDERIDLDAVLDTLRTGYVGLWGAFWRDRKRAVASLSGRLPKLPRKDSVQALFLREQLQSINHLRRVTRGLRQLALRRQARDIP